MLLDALNGPDDLQVAAPTRSWTTSPNRSGTLIIDSVNEHGGHLGSNLGAVELSIALPPGLPFAPRPHPLGHRPPGLRPQDPHRPRSTASRTSAKAAASRATRAAKRVRARLDREQPRIDGAELRPRPRHGVPGQRRPERRRVVAVIGDGALTGGMAFEGLNNLGHSDRDVIIVLNDNGRSYAPTVSRALREPGQDPQQPRYLHAPPGQDRGDRRAHPVGRRADRARRWKHVKGRRPRDVGAVGLLRGSRRSLHGSPSTATTSSRARGASRTPPSSTARSSSTCSPRRVVATHPPSRTTIKNMHDAKPGLRRHPARAMKAGSYTAAFSETLVKLGDQYPELVAITAAMPDSTGLLPFSGAVPRPLHRCRHRRATRRHRGDRHGDGRAATARGRVRERSSPGPSTRSTSTSGSMASRSSSASTGPASPAPTAPPTTASSTSSCSPRSPA